MHQEFRRYFLAITVVEIIEAYELSYGQWGIFLFACASKGKVGITFDNLVSRFKYNLARVVCRLKQNVGT